MAVLRIQEVFDFFQYFVRPVQLHPPHIDPHQTEIVIGPVPGHHRRRIKKLSRFIIAKQAVVQTACFFINLRELIIREEIHKKVDAGAGSDGFFHAAFRFLVLHQLHMRRRIFNQHHCLYRRPEMQAFDLLGGQRVISRQNAAVL